MPPNFLTRQYGLTNDSELAASLSPNERSMAARAGIGFTVAHKALLDGALQSANVVRGSVTLDAAASKAVTVTGATSGSFAFICPTNAAAASLMAGASSLYVTAGTDQITLATADTGSAAGTETFSYLVFI